MAGLEILFLSKEDVDALDLGLDEVMAAIERGLRAHGEKRVVMPSKDHLALDATERHWNILKGYVEPIDVAGWTRVSEATARSGSPVVRDGRAALPIAARSGRILRVLLG